MKAAKRSVPVGARIRLTGQFLRDTGQIVGGEGHRRWTVVECACKLCAGSRFVAVDERSTLMDDDSPRHLLVANVEEVPSPRRER